MENNVLICKVDMFALDQQVIYPDGETEYVSTPELGKYLPVVCYQHNYPKIHLIGNEEFISGLVQEIWQAERTEYNKNDLEIEVN